jgi:cytochrome b561
LIDQIHHTLVTPQIKLNLSNVHPPQTPIFTQTEKYMSRLTRIGLFGLLFILLLSGIVKFCGGYAVYTAPFGIPFAVMILIGLTKRNSGPENEQ